MPKSPDRTDHKRGNSKEKQPLLTRGKILGAVAVAAFAGLWVHEKVADANRLQAARVEMETLNIPYREVKIGTPDDKYHFPAVSSIAEAIVDHNEAVGNNLGMSPLKIELFLEEEFAKQLEAQGYNVPESGLDVGSLMPNTAFRLPASWGIGKEVTPKIDSAESTS
jgi:hypothetical protein